MDNKDINATSGRRKFLVRAGMGSLPVLMALKSKGAWGYSTQNCNLSASMSKMQSVQAEQFETCRAGFLSHGGGKQYFDLGPGNERKGYFNSTSTKYHKNGVETYTYAGIVINENTRFNDIFAGGYGGTLKEAVNQGGDNNLIRNIASSFLHSMFYYGQGLYPEPVAFVDAYNTATLSGQTEQLTKVLRYYIDGTSN
jgi:hypothetical protein